MAAKRRQAPPNPQVIHGIRPQKVHHFVDLRGCLAASLAILPVPARILSDDAMQGT
jgi:hypothetical protein